MRCRPHGSSFEARLGWDGSSKSAWHVLMDNRTGAVFRIYGVDRNLTATKTISLTRAFPRFFLSNLCYLWDCLSTRLDGKRHLPNCGANFSSGEPIMHVDGRGTAMMDREALFCVEIFQLTGLTGPFVKEELWMSHPMKRKWLCYHRYGIESLLAREELRSLLPNIPMVSKPLRLMGTTYPSFMVEQIIDRDGM